MAATIALRTPLDRRVKVIEHGTGTPVVFLVHLAAVMDNWDPQVIDGFAAKHRVVVFDNRGIGASNGDPPWLPDERRRDG